MITTVPSTFQGYVFENFGDSLQEIKLRSDLTHSPLQPTHVRIKVHSAATNPVDYKLIEVGEHFFSTGPTPENPMRLGFDVAGIVVEIGEDVKDLAIGSEVFGSASLGSTGSFAEYIDVDVTTLARKPTNMTFDQAAGAPGVGATSYDALANYGKLKSGQRVLILGGSSATGLFGIQIAKALGASFIGVTTSTPNVEFVQGFGADQAIDYTREKWSEVLEPHSIDLIYDCGVEEKAWDDGAQRVLKKDTGILVTIGMPITPSESPIGASYFHFFNTVKKESLIKVAKLIETNQLITPIDSVHTFENLLDAIKKQKSNRARGKIILQVARE
ncbi:hypothetical protein Poli38472_001009 [Pythium oligandrum]|uniref:Enoyl reductase (ER) domain-containing protein n=1 Tax=Pythium oligandrum TaxID=41045 RepID=A0A8K1CCZ7_PYTOL|nr:hypothetical protein Poli38472_001009 [Pythium oligandrum]|eukprot:TMW60967.1 hypothetical protein Poli38472_001009 [Pythium oligandrum]